jgi:hypothetical protein
MLLVGTHVSVAHLSGNDRMEAALWCLSTFKNADDVDFWGLSGQSDDFTFKNDKDAMAFTLMWG